MMLLKLLTKKNVREVLELLANHGELYFSEIFKTLEINQGTLNKLMTELIENDIVKKRTEEEEVALPKAYYSLTDYGKDVLEVYDLEKKLEGKKSSGNSKESLKINIENVGSNSLNNSFNFSSKK
ncbi:transcriptional regulator PadR family protein [Methanococcus vannielii SB]|uniref:Transcriptional regulator PadR family protein n=2 Tax=Methanococcus vannielii TaxID=2187 RepID=A6USS3_METVS|nr:transcriptional regulator PadR family protein [Methanococcus vannielii SB]